MVWPQKSSDLNIIKYAHDFIKRQGDLSNLTSTLELWQVLQDMWINLPAETLTKVCETVPRKTDTV